MKNAKKNRDPERARARALSDLNCATRKLEAQARDAGCATEAEFFRMFREEAARAAKRVESRQTKGGAA